MALGLNKVTLIGNVGQNPEIRVTNDNREFATFWFATSETWKNKATGDKKENTEWHKVVAFGEGLVEIVRNYVQKGIKLYLEGSLRTLKFVDAASGQNRYSTEVVLQGNSVLILLDSKRNKDESSYTVGPRETDEVSTSEMLDDSIPF